MELMIRSTDQVTTIDGVPVRVWEGVTAEFDRELSEQLPPGRKVSLSQIL